jgi:ceramide glucosyltransferase
VYLNTFYARWMMLAAAIGRPCVVGKSMLFKRSTAERFGGLKFLSRYLAEDYQAGEAIRKLGLKVLIMTDPIEQHLGRYSLRTFWSRHIRWGRIRKSQAPALFAIEPFFGAIVSGLAGAFAFSVAWSVSPQVFLAIHLGVWSLGDFLILRRIWPEYHILTPAAWFLRELLCFPQWLHIASGRTILWRGRKYTILPGGILETSR